MTLSAQAVQRWDRLHTWSSLVCTLFLLVLCVTGLPLIFSDEIGRSGAPATASPAQRRAARSIDSLIEVALAARPGQYVQFVFWDEHSPGQLGIGHAGTPDADLDVVQRVMLDISNGAVMEERPPPAGVMPVILELHRALLVGLPGTLFLSLVALCFLLSIASGIALYAPFAGNRPFGDIRHRERRMRWLDRHNVIGIAVAAWLTVIGATGLMNSLEAPLFGAWQARAMPQLLAPYQGKPLPARLASVDAAVAVAKAALPGMHPTSVGFPYSRFGSPRHYLIWMKGDTHLTEHFFTPVLIDAVDGHLAAAAPLPGYLRALELSRPLHFGDYGGLPMKILWALLDVACIIVLGSGWYLWLRRQRRLR